MFSIVTKHFAILSEQLQASTSFSLVAIARSKFDQPLNCPSLFLARPLHRVIFVLITWLIIDLNNNEVDIMITERCLELSTWLLRPTKSLYSQIQRTVHYFCLCYFIFVRLSKVEYVRKTNSRPLTFDINITYTDLRPQKCLTTPLSHITTNSTLRIQHQKLKTSQFFEVRYQCSRQLCSGRE
jgi:hypothetical protein